MYYLVQENTFKESGYGKLIHALDRLQLPYEIIQVLPFIETLEFKTGRKDVFCFGALKLARVHRQYGWSPGVLMTDNHDYNVYSKHYGEDLLNFDSKIHKFEDDFEWPTEDLFIRPCDDSKVFDGKVFNVEEWLKLKEYFKMEGLVTSLTDDTLIQVASPKKIYREFRFWIVNKRIITASQYKLGSSVVFSNLIDEKAADFCESMANKFQLADAFIIDVALTGEGPKIIECGCINCAGFYESDPQRLLMALEDFF